MYGTSDIRREIIQEVPEVDAVLGTTSYGDIVKALEEAVAGNHFEEFRDIDYLPDTGSKRVLLLADISVIWKIAEGCDKHCTYCIIPKLRGRFRKRSHGAPCCPGRGIWQSRREGADPW